MKKIYNKILNKIKKSSNLLLFIYIILNILTIIFMIKEFNDGNIKNIMLCVSALISYNIPYVLEQVFKISIPSILKILVLLFIFSGEMLGEVNNYYGKINYFDDILHITKGFISTSVGFSLVYLLNKKLLSDKLSHIFILIFSISFSLSICVVWEFFEYSMDNIFNLDMQKDTYVYKLNTVKFNKINKLIKIDNIDHTIIYYKNNNNLKTIKGYLDIGLHDTMKDLFDNIIGGLIYSILAYLYLLNKFKLAGIFLIKLS